MNQSRRDLLKFFAAGTIIAPLSGEVTARLIEPPKAEIIQPNTSIVRPFVPADIVGVKVTFRMRDGSQRTISDDGGDYIPFSRLAYRDGRAISELIVEVSVLELKPTSPEWYDTAATLRMKGTPA